MNLMDKFFEMDRPDAIRSLELYKENMLLNDKLNTFYSAINNIQMLRGAVQFPTLQVRGSRLHPTAASNGISEVWDSTHSPQSSAQCSLSWYSSAPAEAPEGI